MTFQENHKVVKTQLVKPLTTLDDYTGWDIVIRNNGTIEELVKEIEKQLT